LPLRRGFARIDTELFPRPFGGQPRLVYYNIDRIVIYGYRRMLDSRKHSSINVMAAGAKLDRGNIGRLLQLTQLAPDIVQELMDGRQPVGVTPPVLMEPFPVEWGKQSALLIDDASGHE
jgi:hypothetical protein